MGKREVAKKSIRVCYSQKKDKFPITGVEEGQNHVSEKQTMRLHYQENGETKKENSR